MGKINGCLKYIFIIFNFLFVVLGGLLILFGVIFSASSTEISSLHTSDLYGYWVFVIGVALLGIWAASYEKVLALKIFAGFMGTGMIIMIISGIIVAVHRNQLKTAMLDASSEEVQTFMKEPLMKEMLKKIQSDLECCGIVSAEDWGHEIPESCGCKSLMKYEYRSTSGCTSKPQGTSGPDTVYAKSCGVFIFLAEDINLKTSMGIYLGFAVIALLGLIVTICMIRQLTRNDANESMAMRG